jgi:hypothetical protein
MCATVPAHVRNCICSCAWLYLYSPMCFNCTRVLSATVLVYWLSYTFVDICKCTHVVVVKCHICKCTFQLAAMGLYSLCLVRHMHEHFLPRAPRTRSPGRSSRAYSLSHLEVLARAPATPLGRTLSRGRILRSCSRARRATRRYLVPPAVPFRKVCLFFSRTPQTG